MIKANRMISSAYERRRCRVIDNYNEQGLQLILAMRWRSFSVDNDVSQKRIGISTQVEYIVVMMAKSFRALASSLGNQAAQGLQLILA